MMLRPSGGPGGGAISTIESSPSEAAMGGVGARRMGCLPFDLLGEVYDIIGKDQLG